MTYSTVSMHLYLILLLILRSHIFHTSKVLLMDNLPKYFGIFKCISVMMLWFFHNRTQEISCEQNAISKNILLIKLKLKIFICLWALHVSDSQQTQTAHTTACCRWASNIGGRHTNYKMQSGDIDTILILKSSKVIYIVHVVCLPYVRHPI